MLSRFPHTFDYTRLLAQQSLDPCSLMNRKSHTTIHFTVLACVAALSHDGAAYSRDLPAEQPSFRHDVMAVLSRAGCNMGTCHGNANGKGGLKLSLRGQDPTADYVTLTRQLGSRRVSIVDPDSSLLLRKPTMSMPHQGGRRFDSNSLEYRILRNWIADGMPRDAKDSPHVTSLAASPNHATLYAPETSVQLGVTASFSDGSERDVSKLVVYHSSSLFVSVGENGVASAERACQTIVTARYLDHQIPIRLEFVPDNPNFVSAAPRPANFIDEAVFTQLKRLRINPSGICDDTTFLRRVYLDVTGLLPTVEQAQTFVSSSEPDKRARLIDELLASPEFNDMQALRWADLLRVEEKTLDTKGVAVFHAWIRNSFVKEKPLNEFARELLEARGSTYKVPATNLYRSLRTPETRGEVTAQLFLGVRLQCAKCHNHPFDRWTQEDYYGWSNYFARIDYKIIENKRRDKFDKHEFAGEQIVLLKNEGDVKNAATGQAAGLRFLSASGDASAISEPGKDAKLDRLQQVARWMSSATNERFAATQANRIWYQITGRGIVDPVDDFRSTNPPVNPELLDALQAEFVRGGFRLRPLMRHILNSQTYQLSSAPNETNRANAHLFARVEPSRLTAEQTLDAVSQVLGVAVKFGDQKPGTKAVQLAGVRNGGHRYSPPEIGDRFLALFGKPSRQLSCECERAGETTLAQTLELCGGDLIDQLLRDDTGRIGKSIGRNDSDEQIVDDLYWSALSRAPSEDESAAALVHIRNQPNRRPGLEDVAWALLNSNDFLLRR